MMWMKYFIQTTFLLLVRYKNLIRLLQLIEGGIFMSSNGNLLQMVFDGVWETGEMIFKYFTKEEVKKAPLEIFFEKVGLCNKDQEYPKLVEKVVKENHEKLIEFNEVPDAEQYRETLKIKESLIKGKKIDE